MIFETYATLIEQCIEQLGVSASLCRSDKKGQWNLTYKNSTVWIDLFNFQDNPDRHYFQVMSPLLRIPDRNKEEVFKNILEINHNLYGSWISIKGDWMYVMCLREADNLDASEINATLDRVAFYSSDYYNKISFKFEGSWDPKPTDRTINNN